MLGALVVLADFGAVKTWDGTAAFVDAGVKGVAVAVVASTTAGCFTGGGGCGGASFFFLRLKPLRNFIELNNLAGSFAMPGCDSSGASGFFVTFGRGSVFGFSLEEIFSGGAVTDFSAAGFCGGTGLIGFSLTPRKSAATSAMMSSIGVAPRSKTLVAPALVPRRFHMAIIAALVQT
ncbi:MAG TPA: hypothetical protein VK615_00600 [Candidatus Binatia bacterium]|nr:hypothetical protein [Candidatus Binatia bacterium]